MPDTTQWIIISLIIVIGFVAFIVWARSEPGRSALEKRLGASRIMPRRTRLIKHHPTRTGGGKSVKRTGRR